jgi:hypothetical protein
MPDTTPTGGSEELKHGGRTYNTRTASSDTD